MSHTDEIFEKCALFAPEGLSETESAALREACICAESEFEARLRKDADVSETLFVSACAVLALSLFVQLSDTGSSASGIKLGSLSITKRGAGSARSSAAALRKQAENMLSAQLEDRGFFFAGVRG